MRRLLVLSLVGLLLTLPTGARASCAAPGPDTLTFRQMIRRGTTGGDYFHRMILGRVVRIRDPGDKGGAAVAVFAVGAHPTGFVPLVARVHFFRPAPGQYIEDNLNYHVGEHWVVIARHRHGGWYQSDGGCGQTREVGRLRFRSLMRLARRAR